MSRPPLYARMSEAARAVTTIATTAKPVPGSSTVSPPVGIGGTQIAGQRSYEPSDRLPERARLKYLYLRDEARDVHAALSPVADERNELHQDKLRAEAQLRKLEMDLQRGIFFHADEDRMDKVRQHPAWVEASAKFDWLASEFKRVNEHYERAAARLQPRRALVGALERYLRSVPREVALEEWEGPPPQLKRGENAAGAVTRVRGAIEKKQAEIEQIKRAPYTSDEAKQIIRDEVERLRKLGIPNITSVVEHAEKHQHIWPREYVMQANGTVDLGRLATNSLAIMAWFDPEALIARLEAEVDLRQDDAAALSKADRAKLEAEALDALLLLERQEEAAIESAEVEIARRGDADPRAVLVINGPAPLQPGERRRK